MGADGPIQSPDAILRMHLSVLRLEKFLVDMGADGVNALRAMAADYARQAHALSQRPEGPQSPPESP